MRDVIFHNYFFVTVMALLITARFMFRCECLSLTCFVWRSFWRYYVIQYSWYYLCDKIVVKDSVGYKVAKENACCSFRLLVAPLVCSTYDLFKEKGHSLTYSLWLMHEPSFPFVEVDEITLKSCQGTILH